MVQTHMRIGIIQIAIIVLTLATAAIHFTLNFPDPVFILNSLGYVTLLALLYLPLPVPLIAENRRWVRWALIAFAAITILAWLAIGMRNTVGYTAKTIEVVLIILLFIEGRQQ